MESGGNFDGGGLVGTSKIILDFILSSVWSGDSWSELERLGEKW